MNEQTFTEYFRYQTPSFFVKDSYEDNQIKKCTIVKYLNYLLIDLRNFFNSKEIPENKNQKNAISIVDKILDFNKQGKRLKILTPKQTLCTFTSKSW